MQPEEQKGDEVEERGPSHGYVRGKNTRRYDRCNRIGGVMQAVEKIEDESDQDQGCEEHERACHRKAPRFAVKRAR
jgi:hypothetical protein